MRFVSPYQHNLDNLNRLVEIYKNPQKTTQEALFLATGLTTHGFAEAGGLLAAMRTEYVHKSMDAYLADLQLQCGSIQQLPGLDINLRNQKLLTSMYGLDGGYFEKGRHHPDILLIVFSTMFNNFYISNLVMLTMLRQFGISVLFLKDPSIFNFLRGVDGVGGNLQAVAAVVKGIIADHGIEKVYISGFSSSGFASLLFTTLIGCEGYLGFSIRSDLSGDSKLGSGKFFTSQARAQIDSEWLIDLGEVLHCARDDVRRKIVFGSMSEIDKAHAMHLQGVDNLKIVEISDCGHQTVASLLSKGTLQEEFRSLIFDVH